MINIQKIGNAIVIDFTDNDKYLHNGTIEVAPNELMVVIDESDMATFKKISNGDTLFGQLINQIQIQGEAVTKDNIIDKFGMIGFTSGGGAVNSVNGQTGEVVITAASLGAITKSDADTLYAAKSELEEKQEVFQVNSPMAFNRDEATQDLHLSIDLSGYATKEELTSKADTSTVESLSGIVANQSTDISNLYTQVNQNSGKITTLNTKVNNKQDTLVSGTNIKTVNGESILGEGNIEISGGGTITVDAELSETSENPVQNKVITAALNGKQAAGDYALKSEAATKEELATTNAELEHKADKTSVYTVQEVDNKLAAKQATLIQGTNITLSEPNAEGKVTISASQPDITGLATKTELTEGLAGKQDKGNYALKSDLNTLATKEELATKADVSALSSKQDTLVSGTNIKTINGETILGSGNLTIQSGTQPRTWEVHINADITSDVELNPTPVGWQLSEFAPAFGDIIKFTSVSGTYNLVVTGKNEQSKVYLLSSISYGGAYILSIGVRYGALQIYKTIPVLKNDWKVLIGSGATGTGDSSVTIGRNSSNTTGVAIGDTASSGDDAIAIGNNVTASEAGSINIGNKIKVDSTGFKYTGKNGEVNLDDALVKDTEMLDTSENAVQNKVIKKYIDDLVGNILTQLQEINGTN